MTTLTTAASLTLDRLLYTVQIRSAVVELAALPGVGRADVVIAAGVEVEAQPGASATLELDGGDGAATVMTGTVDHVERHVEGTLVALTDAGADLARVRPQETYNGMGAAAIIRALAGLADVSPGPLAAALQTAAYVADPHRTAAHHVAALAQRAGGLATIDPEGRLTVTAWPVGIATAAMRLDREFVTLSTSAHRPAHAFASVGGGGSGAAMAPDAWLVNADPVTSAQDPDASLTWRADPVLRTSADVDLANRSAQARRAAATRRLLAECWLQPARRPGDVLEIQETRHPDQAGPWLLTSVRHQLTPTSARTSLTGVTAGAAPDLLGSLAGAIGGLL